MILYALPTEVKNPILSFIGSALPLQNHRASKLKYPSGGDMIAIPRMLASASTVRLVA